MILNNLHASEIAAPYQNIVSWVKTLNLGNDEKNTIVILQKSRLNLEYLLDPTITMKQISAALKESKHKIHMFSLNKVTLQPGIVLNLLSAIAQERKVQEETLRSTLQITNAIKERERDIVNAHKVSTTSTVISNESSQSVKDIFLSYCWANKQTVQKLHNILKEKGFSCWIDDNVMQGGSQLFEKIDDGISQCKVFVACCSNNYGSSVNCQRELLLATDRKKLIIPAIVAPCEPWPPKGQMGPLLAGKLYVDLSTEEKFEKIFEQLITAVSQSLT